MGKTKQSQDIEQNQPEEEIREQSLRSAVLQAKAAKDKLDKDKKIKEGNKTSYAQKVRSRRLRAAWYVLLPSGGFSLLYIHMHIFARMVIGKQFCKLGEEWKGVSNVVKSLLRFAEITTIIFLDLIAIFFIACFIMIIIFAMENPYLSGAIVGGSVIGGLVLDFYSPN